MDRKMDDPQEPAPARRAPEVFMPQVLPHDLSTRRSPSPSPEQPAPDPLAPGKALAEEKVLYEGHPSVLNFATSILFSGMVLGAGILLFWMNPLILWSGITLTGGTALRIWLVRRYWRYTVTPTRIEVVYGIINRSSEEVRIRDIRNINVRREGLSGWLRVGDVEIATAGSGSVEVVFHGVIFPHTVKDLVRSLQDKLPH